MQVVVNKEVPTIEGLLASAGLSDNTVLSELLHAEAGLAVNRPDLINRGNAAYMQHMTFHTHGCLAS